jgi:hypothetical protein
VTVADGGGVSVDITLIVRCQPTGTGERRRCLFVSAQASESLRGCGESSRIVLTGAGEMKPGLARSLPVFTAHQRFGQALQAGEAGSAVECELAQMQIVFGVLAAEGGRLNRCDLAALSPRLSASLALARVLAADSGRGSSRM